MFFQDTSFFSFDTTKLSGAALFHVWKACSNQSARSPCLQLLKRDLASCVRGRHFTSNRNTSRRWEHRFKNQRLLVGEMPQEDEFPKGLLEAVVWCSGNSAMLDSPSCENREREVWWESLWALWDEEKGTQCQSLSAEGLGFVMKTDNHTVQHWGYTTQVMSNNPEISK